MYFKIVDILNSSSYKFIKRKRRILKIVIKLQNKYNFPILFKGKKKKNPIILQSFSLENSRSRLRVAIPRKFENTRCIHFETKDRLSPRQQCITCLDSRTVSRTCIPDRYVTQSEFDKKQISNSLWWIQPCSPRDKTASRDRREPRLSFDGRRYFYHSPFYTRDSFLRDYRAFFKEIPIKMSNRILLFP